MLGYVAIHRMASYTYHIARVVPILYFPSLQCSDNPIPPYAMENENEIEDALYSHPCNKTHTSIHTHTCRRRHEASKSKHITHFRNGVSIAVGPLSMKRGGNVCDWSEFARDNCIATVSIREESTGIYVCAYVCVCNGR